MTRFVDFGGITCTVGPNGITLWNDFPEVATSPAPSPAWRSLRTALRQRFDRRQARRFYRDVRRSAHDTVYTVTVRP